MVDRNVSIGAQADKERDISARLRERLLRGLGVTERRLELNGISTAVLEAGDGPPIVLLHGPGAHAANWQHVIPALAASHRVIAPDLPGHGSSAGLDVVLDVDRMIGWLDDLIDCTCSERPFVCGQTLGGAIAARYASARGDRVRGLVLVNALGLQAFQPVPEFGMALGEYMMQPSEETHERLWHQCVFDLAAMRRRMGERWEGLKAYNLDRARAMELKAAQTSLMEHLGMPAIAPSELATISVPTSLIWSRFDRATPLAVAEAASTRYRWPLHVIDDAGDEPHLEQPERFLAALRDALAEPVRDREAQAAWDEIAARYDEFVTPSHLQLGNTAVTLAGVQPGMRFLDVAAGSGALSIPAARRGAKVTAVDISPMMLARLKGRAVSDGLDIETREMDGHHLDLDNDTFDITGSQFGVMLFPDLPRGLAEMVRVTKPGGRVLVVTFGPLPKVEFFGFFMRAMKAALPDFAGPPSDPPPLPFQIADVAVLRRRMSEAGLEHVAIETITETLEFESGQGFWQWLLGSNPLATTITSALAKEQVPIVQQAVDQLIRERAAGRRTAVLTHPIHVGIGEKVA